ncbi:MAG: class I SAM-dependent methyltransferase [Flavobacteriaceae bacterium]
MEHPLASKNNIEETYITTKDFLVSGETFSLVWDKERAFLKTIPQPSGDELPKYYNSEEYISHTDSKKGLFNFLYQSVKGISLNKKASLINRLQKQKGTLLDIGAGTGDFLRKAKDHHWDVQGIEVNEKARQLAFKKGIDLKTSLNDFKDKNFQVVTLWHVLEHLAPLEEMIEKIESLVTEGGNLIIAVPNFQSYDANYYKEYWAAYDVPRHLWHFSQESMQLLFSEKMKLVKTLPMPFDAFYVSLLSEKYKTGNAFSLKAFWIGLRSHLSAMRTKQYSSLIYVFEKQKEAK